jgi:hypothetical protein
MMNWNSTLIFDIKKFRYHPGNVVLTTQEEVNGFSSQYISGSLTVSGGDISDLTPLSCLTGIKGALIIQDNTKLKAVLGFNALIEVGYLRIRNNPNLKIIDGFGAMEQCGGMDIDRNGCLNMVRCFTSPDI